MAKRQKTTQQRRQTKEFGFGFHLFTIREIPGLKREWFISFLTSGWKQQNTCLRSAHSMRETNRWCSVEGTARYLMHARNQINMSTNQRNRRECVLTSAGSPGWKQGNTDMSIKPSYVTKNNKQDENQILPLIHIYPQQHVQVFSESQVPFYTSDNPSAISGPRSNHWVLFLARSKKKTLTKTSLREERNVDVHVMYINVALSKLHARAPTRIRCIAAVIYFLPPNELLSAPLLWDKYFLNVCFSAHVVPALIVFLYVAHHPLYYMRLTRRVSMQLSLGNSGRIRCS